MRQPRIIMAHTGQDWGERWDGVHDYGRAREGGDGGTLDSYFECAAAPDYKSCAYTRERLLLALIYNELHFLGSRNDGLCHPTADPTAGLRDLAAFLMVAEEHTYFGW